MTNPADKLSLLMATPNEEPVSQYKGVVQQTDDSKAYVLIDGGTAVWCDTMDVKALVGDRVRVEVRKHKGTLVANYTHPVTDDAVANAALEKVNALEVDALKADSAVIKNLQADTAKVHDLTADQLSAATAYVGELTAGEVTAQSIIADKAKLAQVDTDQLNADHAVIETLDSTYASIDNLNAATARIGNIEADYLVAADMTAEQVRVGQLMAGKADVADLTAANARIDTLQSTKADISVLESDYITAAAIEATYLHADMSNADVAWIQNGVIKDGSISNAMINDVSANKLTAGTINGSVINVTNLNADNITAGTINGQRIGEGSLSLSKLSEDVYTEQEVNNKLATMQAEIDGAIETWTGTAVPTLNNSPASGWSTSDERDRHVGDVYFVVNSNSQQNGYNYRFTKTNGTYSWQLIKDSDVTNALQRLSTAEGKITTFDSDISTLKTDTGTLKTKTESLETRMSDAEDDILDKVDTTTFNEVSDTVDQHSQTITQMSQTLSNKADGSTVTALTTRVSKTEQDITGINTTIGELQDTVETKADGSTVSTISNKLNTVSDTVDGHTQTLTSVQNTLSSKADSSTVSTLTTKVNNVSDTVDGHTQTIGSMQTTQTTMQGKLDKTIVETTQLWYSKSSTDAPSKPTSQVTSTSTAGNAWRTVVPAYNASYPNYFYCYQWKYTDGTYGWSSVTRDIAMGESQERARTAITNAATADTKAGNAATAAATAQSTADTAKSTADTAKATADKNVKSSLQLWYTKANDTAPSKPTSKVTSTSVSGNAWRTVVPTYSASYPYYFYCYQYELADGTCTWSDVVYDRATTENQSNSRSAITGVSTLTTKTNEISDTVDGHTSQLSSITTTQTSIQGSAVKSTVQLWFTKANTTAPNKPTAHVTTNNASTANAWNLAVPTYNASYPYYYYCYEHQLLNDTYTWSAVTRDIATGESQSTSRSAASAAAAADTKAGNAAAAAATADGKAVSAQNTANKNVRESQQLWYTKANSTAPAKPTSKVTSTATTGGAWTTRVPTYSDSYKHYFYCMQYVAADNTVTWSDVVYDQATTEAQSVARAASADLTEFHQEYATFKQTTQEFESTVGETYATKTALKETDDKIENLDVGGRNLVLKTSESKTSAASASGSAYVTVWNMSDYGYGIMDNTDDVWTISFDYEVSGNEASEAYIYAQVRGTSISANVEDITLPVLENPSGRYSKRFKLTSAQASSTSTQVRMRLRYATDGATFTMSKLKLEKGNKATDWSPAPEDLESTVSSIESRVSTAETSITNNSREIGLRALATDVYTKEDTDGLISTEVTNRNAAIQVSADAINQSVSENYTTKTEFNNLEIGGRNLLPINEWYKSEEGTYTHFGLTFTYEGDGWFSVSGATNSNTGGTNLWADDSYGTAVNSALDGLTGKNLTISVEVDGNPFVSGSAYNDSTHIVCYATGAGYSHRLGGFNSLVQTYTANENFDRISEIRYYVGADVPVGTSINGRFRIKIEFGTKATDWTPAPEDLDVRFESVETAIEQNAETIKLTATKEEVEKTYVTKDDSQLDRAGSGTSVAIDGAATASLKGLHVLGESAQDGTPTPDAPIPINSVSGVNLLDMSEIKIGGGTTWAGLTFTVSEDGWISVSGASTRTSAGVLVLWGNASEATFPSGTYFMGVEVEGLTFSNDYRIQAVYDNNSKFSYINSQSLDTSFLASSNVNAIRFYVYTTANGVEFNGRFRVKLSNAAPRTAWLPYDSLGIRVLGKNLFHQTRYSTTSTTVGITWSFGEDGIITANGTATNISWALARGSSGVFEDVASYAYIDAGTYTASVGGGGLSWALVYLNDSRTRVNIKGVSTVDYYTFTIDEPRLICVVPVVPNGATVSALKFYPQIERGSEATEYEPYSGSVTPIPLNGNELRSLPDDTRDELTIDVDGHVTIVQRVGYLAVNESSSHTTSGAIGSTHWRNNYLLSTDRRAVIQKESLCSMLPWAFDTSASDHFFISGGNNIATIVAATTESGALSSLSGAEFIYPLETPQTIDLGTIDMPQVHDGDTVEVIAALTPSIDVTWWASAGQAVADAYASLSSAIEVRAESIVSTVSERYATSQEVQAISSQITQTAQGWTAQFNQLTGGADLSMTLAEAFEALGVTSRNLEEIRSFVRITTDDSGDPLLLMGSATSPIMLALSNDSLRFMHGSDPVAYIDVDGTTNEGRLHITRAVVVKELQFGSWKWFERDGVGNLALKWVGDE